jgi:hypothetical protein
VGIRVHWKEGEFLVGGEHGILVLFRLLENGSSFTVEARPNYADAVCKTLRRAAQMMTLII